MNLEVTARIADVNPKHEGALRRMIDDFFAELPKRIRIGEVTVSYGKPEKPALKLVKKRVRK